MEAVDYIKQRYENKPEEGRLEKDKSHNIEFITTKKYIEAYLKPGDRILEIGAATGHYSLYYAAQGYQVDALELLDCNIKVFKSKIKPGMNVTVRQGNALDLSAYPDNTFDVTLCFGPLYHLFTEQDKRKCIAEAVRVTKPGGIVYFAYLSSFAVFIEWNQKNWDHLLEPERTFDDRYRMIDKSEHVFSAVYPEEMEEMMAGFHVERLHVAATDGIATIIWRRVNEMTDEQYAVWTKFHLYTCERPDMLGTSCHLLYVCRKK